jgi:replication factor C large subunit
MGLYSRIIKEERAAVEVTADLGLELEELMYLTGSTKVSKKLQKIYDEAQELYREGSEEAEEVEFFKTPVPSGSDRQIPPECAVEPEEKKDGESPAGKSETSSSLISENKQKISNSGRDFIPDNFSSDGSILDSPTPDNLASDRSKPDDKPIDSEISARSSKRNAHAKSRLVVEKDSELKPANLEAEAVKTPKKTESKSQKSLFDF